MGDSGKVRGKKQFRFKGTGFDQAKDVGQQNS